EQGEAEKEIGLHHGCLLLPRNTNGKAIVSKSCGQGQSFLSVQAGPDCNRSCYIDLELPIRR
ncbi:hypothetical protein Tco_0981210, partial [Tanacetum coccineum]